MVVPNKPPTLSTPPTMPGHIYSGVPAEPPDKKNLGPVGRFIAEYYRHFNAATLKESAEAYCELIDRGGKMFLAMAGAMSTGEIGVCLAKMIRAGKIHGICVTGANLEEDLFNLVAHSKYLRLPSYRDLTAEDEESLLAAELPRVTDTCIPEREAMMAIEDIVREYWEEATEAGESHFPHEYLYRAIREGRLEDHMEIDPKDSWMVAASEKDLPIFVPGWEDSTLGNMFASLCIKGELDPHAVKGGIHYMMALHDWYLEETKGKGEVGFFQIGGGIAGDFPICVVPLLRNDLKMPDAKLWSYFCQISDSTTSYGSYSGAVPNEKITWEKLGKETPRFVIESDAAIVAPLIFAYVLGL
jgi:deoxyhypusine synthase